METKAILLQLRESRGLTQAQLAEKVHVTRQAVSRWENGETTPDIESLKALSKLFEVSINTLLGSPQKLICQCCAMPLSDEIISREPDQSLNEDYCKWCYQDGAFAYTSMADLQDFLAENMSTEGVSKDAIRAYYGQVLPQLKHWKK